MILGIENWERQSSEAEDRRRSAAGVESDPPNDVQANVRPEDTRHGDCTIGSQVSLEDRDQHAGQRQARAVEGVRIAWTAAFGWLVADVGAARLEVTGVTATRDLEPLFDARG